MDLELTPALVRFRMRTDVCHPAAAVSVQRGSDIVV